MYDKINTKSIRKIEFFINEDEICSALDSIEELHPGHYPRIKWVSERGLKNAFGILWKIYREVTGDNERDVLDNDNYDGCFLIEALIDKANKEHDKTMKSYGWPPDYQTVLNSLNPEID